MTFAFDARGKCRGALACSSARWPSPTRIRCQARLGVLAGSLLAAMVEYLVLGIPRGEPADG